MLLVIFGAGASYDCGRPLQPLRIPLAFDLVTPAFGGIAMDITASRPIIDRLRHRMTGDRAGSLESELASLSEQSGSSPERRQQLIAFRFYLQEVIRSTAQKWLNNAFGFSHYLTLLNYLYDWNPQTGLHRAQSAFEWPANMLKRCGIDPPRITPSLSLAGGPRGHAIELLQGSIPQEGLMPGLGSGSLSRRDSPSS